MYKVNIGWPISISLYVYFKEIEKHILKNIRSPFPIFFIQNIGKLYNW